MSPASLPLVGAPANTEKDYLGAFTSLEGKRVLCIGYSESEIDSLVAKYHPAQITVLTNWADHTDAKVLQYKIVIGDICKRTQFPDASFDSIISLSVLEHLSDLNGAMNEMRRITKKGGEHLHFFGPAWSSAPGHHCYARGGDRLMDFSQWQTPAHIHLLCSAEEITTFYRESGYSDGEVGWVLKCMFETDIINRAFYDDYAKLFDGFQIDKMELMYHQLPKDHLKALRSKYPYRDFSTYGGKYRLVI